MICRAQQTYIYGVVKDSISRKEMIGVHIRNISAGDTLTVTNEKGKFRMIVQVGDTLSFSSVGHKTLAHIVDPLWRSSDEIEFLLSTHTIYLEEVVIRNFPEYEQFKNLIIKEQPKDTTFHVFGLPQVVMSSYPQLEKREYLNPVFVFFHPISALHHSFSKKEKEKRKMQAIHKQKFMAEKAQLKFTREWVSQNTRLVGDTLTRFMVYCNFSDEYLASSSQYAVYELMMDFLPKFLEKIEEN